MSKVSKWFHGWFDRLPGGVQRIVYIASAALAYAGITWLDNTYLSWKLPAAVQFALAVLVPLVVGYVTPITQQIGRKGGVANIKDVVNAVEGKPGA